MRGSTRWPARCRPRRRGGPRRRRAGTRRRSRPGCGATSARTSPATSCGSRSSASGPPSPRTSRCCTCSSTSASAGSLEILTDTEGGAQQDRIVGGSQLISLRMAEQLGPGRGRARRPRCARSATRDDGVTVVSDRLDGRREAGDRRRAADPRRPDRLRPAAAGDPRRPLAADGAGERRQVHGGLRAAVLARARPLGGGHQRSPGRSRSASTTRRPTAAPGSCSASSRAGRRARRPICRSRSGGGSSPIASPASSAPRRPSRSATSTVPGRADEWSRGCYGGFMPPGAWTDYGPALREPIGPIHWAGAETALVWNGYMDGAIGSGQDAASGGDRGAVIDRCWRRIAAQFATMAPRFCGDQPGTSVRTSPSSRRS